MYPTDCEADNQSLLGFSKSIVDAVSNFVCAFKINHAHFASKGCEDDLEFLIGHIHSTSPHVPVILDAKRGDVGATAVKYAEEAFERYSADAVTVNPYMGWDTVEPFLQYTGRGVILLCKTSNPGSYWLQDEPQESPIYLRIANRVQQEANPNLMLVVGATDESALGRVRQAAPDVTLLVPGVGAQGGSAADVLRIGRRVDGSGLIVNCSRSVISQDGGSPFYFEKVASTAETMSKALSLNAPF